MKNLKVKIYTLGCKVNQYDSGRLAAEFKRANFVIAKNAADLAIINSCAVTKTAMIKSRRMIKLARKENPGAKVVLAGCWARIAGQKIKGVDLVIRENNIQELAAAILSFRPSSRNPEFSATNKFLDRGSGPAMTKTERARYFIKIQDGCEQFCSYCIVPYTRGKLASRGEKEVIDEIKRAAKAGYREIVLSGIHLGLYQSVMPDLIRHPEKMAAKRNLDSRPPNGRASLRGNDNNNLTDLIKKLLKIDGLGRIRLSSIEITEVTEELIKLMMKSKKICRHLHIPLQSGSDKILKLMNRPYDTEYFKNKIKLIRRAMPDIAISTDVIVGFPGETEKDFRDTEKLIKQIKFSRLHVFPFSAHVQTPAAKLPNQLKEKEKQRRSEILRQLGERLAKDYRKKFKGKKLEVVVERINGDWLTGKTEYYFDIEFKSKKKNLIRKIVKAKI